MFCKQLVWPGLRKFVNITGVAVLSMFLAGGCATKEEAPIPPRPVEVGKAIVKDVPVYIDSFGTMAVINNIDIVSQVTGKVQEAHFQEGDNIQAGGLLFTIDPSEYKARLDKAEAALQQDVVDLKLKRDIMERNKPLVEKNLISQQDFDQFQTDVNVSQARVDVDKAEIELAKINLGYCNIYSPVDGLTGKRLVDPGNIVTANSGPVLVNIKTVDPLYIDFTVSEANLIKARQAMAKRKLTVEITPPEAEDKIYDATLQFLNNTVDNTTGTIALRAIVDNKKRELWPGQFVNIRLILETEKNALLVPYEAVSLGQQGSYLFVVTKDNKADLRTVTTGLLQEDYVVVETGVKEGETVVTEGQMGLAPGVTVVITTDQDQVKR